MQNTAVGSKSFLTQPSVTSLRKMKRVGFPVLTVLLPFVFDRVVGGGEGSMKSVNGREACPRSVVLLCCCVTARRARLTNRRSNINR